MGTVLKTSSFSWLRQQRVRSAARQSFCRASTSPQGTAYSHGVMSSESCSPPALPRLLVVRHRVLLPMMQPPAVTLCWLLYRLAWTWQLPVWPQRNEMPLIFSSCRCWAEDAQCYLHQGSLQGSFGVVSDQCMGMSVCIHPFLNLFSGFCTLPFSISYSQYFKIESSLFMYSFGQHGHIHKAGWFPAQNAGWGTFKVMQVNV